ncbi:redoxin domain-containing protein [Oligoflexaceae bacterium]|nr:redoxin domain-containing protein [Oligoflexaceae bacterium]
MNDLEIPGRSGRYKLITGSLFIGIFVLITTLYLGLKQEKEELEAHFVGKPAKAFSAEWIQGQPLIAKATGANFTLADLKGKNVILNFWASWCVSCRSEAANLEKYHEMTTGSDTIVVGIAIQDTIEAATKFAQHFGKRYALGLDTDGSISIDYGVTGVPETVFIDKEGIVRHKFVGPLDVPMLVDLHKTYF